MSMLLEVEDLGVDFSTPGGVVRAVDAVSYSVEKGKTLAVVGGPGSGKSVSSLALLGLSCNATARISGRVVFAGRDLLNLPDDELRTIRGDEIGMVAQDRSSSLHPFHRVGTQLIETIVAHREISKAAARDRAIDLLELIGVPEPHRRVDQLPDELSPSMRRRASIAIALANEPELLIADEPTGGLDLTVQAEILELLGRIQKRLGMAIVLFSRDLAVAAELAEEICVMCTGRIVEHAPTERILDSPQDPYTSSLLRASLWPQVKEGSDQPAITPRPRHTATPEPAPGRADPRA